MTNYLLAYKGEGTDMSELPPEEAEAVMAKWGEWMGKVGEALVDMGAPFGESVSLLDDGSEGKASPLTGYSIITADDLVHAKKLVDGHPYLSDNDGKFAVDVYELTPVPEM